MEITVPSKTFSRPGPVAILLILLYNLALLAGASYLVYYKDASAWLYVLALCFGATWSEKEKS